MADEVSEEQTSSRQHKKNAIKHPGELDYGGWNCAWAPQNDLITDQSRMSGRSSKVLPLVQDRWGLDTDPQIWMVVMKSIWYKNIKIDRGRRGWNLPQMMRKKSWKILRILLKDWRSQLWRLLGDPKSISGGPQLIRGTSGTIEQQ